MSSKCIWRGGTVAKDSDLGQGLNLSRWNVNYSNLFRTERDSNFWPKCAHVQSIRFKQECAKFHPYSVKCDLEQLNPCERKPVLHFNDGAHAQTTTALTLFNSPGCDSQMSCRRVSLLCSLAILKKCQCWLLYYDSKTNIHPNKPSLLCTPAHNMNK